MKVLVTGGAGYVGARLVARLVTLGDDIIAIDRFYFGRDHLPEHPRLRWIDADVRDVGRLPLEGVDAVVALAAASSDSSAADAKRHAFEIGVLARENIAVISRELGVRRLVLPSSSNVYESATAPLPETAPTVANSTYTAICLEAERRLLQLSDRDFGVVVLRKATLYGW